MYTLVAILIVAFIVAISIQIDNFKQKRRKNIRTLKAKSLSQRLVDFEQEEIEFLLDQYVENGELFITALAESLEKSGKIPLTNSFRARMAMGDLDYAADISDHATSYYQFPFVSTDFYNDALSKGFVDKQRKPSAKFEAAIKELATLL